MLNNVNYYYPDFPRKKIPTIDKDQLPVRPFIFNNHNIIAGNQASGNREVEEFKKMLAQSKVGNTNKDEERTTSDKSTPTDIGSTLAKQGLYELTGSKLIKPNPYLVAMTLLGVDFEEDGDALTKGAETGKLPNFKDDYKNYFNNMWDKADSEWNAAWEGFNLPANVISIGLQDCLQSCGVAFSKVLGKEPVIFLGSGVSAVGTAFNAIGDVAGDTLKGTVGMVKNLFTGDFDGVGDSAEGIYNGVKDGVLNVTDAAVDVAKNGADLVKKAAEETYDIAKDGANYVADAAEEAYNAVANATKEAGNAIADVAEEIGDFAEDAWDEVEDFFSSIF